MLNYLNLLLKYMYVLISYLSNNSLVYFSEIDCVYVYIRLRVVGSLVSIVMSL